MKRIIILSLLPAFLLSELNISACCPDSQVINTETKMCQADDLTLDRSVISVNVLSLKSNKDKSLNINLSTIPSNPISHCDIHSPIIIESFYLFDHSENTNLVDLARKEIIPMFCLGLSSAPTSPSTAVSLGCLPCTREKPCLNYCCPKDHRTVNGICINRTLESHHWKSGKDHKVLNIRPNCQNPVVYPTFILTEEGDMEVDGIIHEPSKYCINHGEKETSVLLCHQDASMNLEQIFKMTLMILSLLSLVVNIIILLVIEEARRQHFTKLKIPFYSCLFTSFIFVIISNLHDFKHSAIICTFIALGIQYFSLAIFFWLTCMSIDIWLTFNRLESPLQNPTRREARLKRRLRCFFFFAFGSPFIITMITLVLQVASEPDEASYTHPGIGTTSCFFHQHLPQFLYFHLMLLILLCVNMVFYFLMVYKFTFGIWRDNHFESAKMRNSKVFTELVFLMGINWISESVTFFVGWFAGSHWDNPFLVFLSSVNWSIGIFMLILCLAKKVNRKLIRSCIKESVRSFDSQLTVSTQVSSREEVYELTSSDDQPIESANSGSSNSVFQGGHSMSMWGYMDHNGPTKWEEWFPISSEGFQQSPIDIAESACIQKSVLPTLEFTYHAETSRSIKNDGNGWTVMTDPRLSSLSGGPLSSEYKLVQYQAHWGSCAGEGSEHMVNGEQYDAELHLVHYNTKYASMAQALGWPDGLAIMAVLLKIGRQHQEFSKLCIILNHVQRKGHHRDISTLNLSPDKFLPENKSYFTYPGSLTTPPLSECVTWLVFRQPVEISSQQINAMRLLNMSRPEEEEDRIRNNCRPVQPVGERRVLMNTEDQ